MRGFRAKDADRDRFVELIEAAYVDGQIGDADRELPRRPGAVGRDARRAPDPHPRPAAAGRPRARRRRRPAPPSRSSAALSVRLAQGGWRGRGPGRLHRARRGRRHRDRGAVLLRVERRRGHRPRPGCRRPPPHPRCRSRRPRRRRSTMTAGSVRAFLAAYEEQFGTREAYEVDFFPDRVRARCRSAGRGRAWSGGPGPASGGRTPRPSAVTGPDQRVDTGAIDVRRMFANIDVAKRTLDVERGRLTHAILHRVGRRADGAEHLHRQPSSTRAATSGPRRPATSCAPTPTAGDRSHVTAAAPAARGCGTMCGHDCGQDQPRQLLRGLHRRAGHRPRHAPHDHRGRPGALRRDLPDPLRGPVVRRARRVGRPGRPTRSRS